MEEDTLAPLSCFPPNYAPGARGEDAPFSVMLPPAPPASELPEPAPPEKQCEECAAVKRLRGGTSVDGLSAWHARPCVHGAISKQKTGPQAPAAGVSSTAMRSALKEDLQPRRLFDMFGGPSEDNFEEDELEFDMFTGVEDADSSSLSSSSVGAGSGGATAAAAAAAAAVEGMSSPAVPRPPSALSLPHSSPAAGTPMMADIDGLQLSVVLPGSPSPMRGDVLCDDCDEDGDDATPNAAHVAAAAEGWTAGMLQPTQLSFGGLATAAASSSSSDGGFPLFAPISDGTASSSSSSWNEPPPMLPSSSFEAAVAARSVAQSPVVARMHSPGLAYAAARMIRADGGGSSCATPSRTPGPGRPATPGAPGSNVRRTTSFIDGIEADDNGEDAVHSITDLAVLMQLSQSLTSITLGSKRSYSERD